MEKWSADIVLMLTINRVQLVQNSYLRFFYGVRKYQHISQNLKQSSWLNMAEWRALHQIYSFYKIVKLKLYYIIFRTHVHNNNIRFREKITPLYHKNEFFQRSISHNIRPSDNYYA